LKNVEDSLGEIPLRFSLFSGGFAFWHPTPSHESQERTFKNQNADRLVQSIAFREAAEMQSGIVDE